MKYFYVLTNINWLVKFSARFFLYSFDLIIYYTIKHVFFVSKIKFNNINGVGALFNFRLFKNFFKNECIYYKTANELNNSLISKQLFLKYNIYDFFYLHTNILLLNFIFLQKYKSINFDLLVSFKNLFRLKQTNLGFFIYTSKLNSFVLVFENYILLFYSGLQYLWKAVRLWILAIGLSMFVFYFSLIFRILPFNKVIFSWFAFFMIFYWIVSGFVFFFKKYQYGKYTSALQRFWRRSYILFWLLESSLLIVFIYLTFVASQEAFYMFDEIQIYKTHLFSWRFFFLKIFPLVLLLNLAYFFLLTLKWGVFSKHSYWLLLFTVGLTYIVWLEFYQFFHIINFYGNATWNYDFEEKFWNLEIEARRTRIVNHYIMWLLILKFWHLLFVYVFWIFFVLRNFEKVQIKYPLFSANHQNLIILFIMSWIYMFPWFKIYFRKFADVSYFWFYVNNRSFLVRNFFGDVKKIWYGLNNFLTNKVSFEIYYRSIPFFYWIETNKFLIFNQTRKHNIRNQIIDLVLTN